MIKMAVVILVILIVLIIVSNNSTINNLKEENKKLKKQISIMKEFIKKYIPEGEKVSNVFSEKVSITEKTIINSEASFEKETYEEKAENIKEVKKVIQTKVKKPVNAEDNKNILILITGAIFIILAAIVFLMTTWYTIPNILKTVVLTCLIFVFLGASNIAKNRFKLDRASKTFFFMAMAYIPICLYSISIFGLFGEYLSIYGEGKNIYLTLSAILVAIIYFFNYKITKNKFLIYGSLLSQQLSIILFTAVLKVDFNIFLFNLGIYNLLLLLITSSSKEKELYMNFGRIVPFVILGLSLFNFDFENIFYTLSFVVLAINFLILELKETKNIYSYLFNTIYLIAGLNFIGRNIDIEDNIREIIMLLFMIASYFIENAFLIGKNKINLKKASVVMTIAFLMMFHLQVDFIKNYIVSIIIILMSLIAYKNSKETGKNISAILISIYFILTGTTFLYDLDLSYHYYVIFSLISFLLGEFISGKDMDILKKYCFAISHVFIGITYFICLSFKEEFINDVFYMFMLMLVYTYSYFKDTRIVAFKYFSYITSNLLLISGCEFFKIDSTEIHNLIPLITTSGIIFLENKYERLKDSFSKFYLLICKIVVFATLIEVEELGIILSIVFASYLIYDNIVKKENDLYNIVPLLGMMCTLSSCSNDMIILMIALMVSIATTVLSLYKNKISVYTVFSLIYLYGAMEIIGNTFCAEIVFILWSMLHCIFAKDDKFKDIYKVLNYIGITAFYYEIVDYADLGNYCLFSSLGYMMLSITVLRKVLIKYVKDIDIVEYLTYGFLYLSTMSNYSDITDAMLFLLLIVGLIIYSYLKRYGALFIASSIAILVNVLIITKDFWLIVPWWVYLLVLGGILISFAVSNEARENKEKLSVGKIINKIKENVEK